MALCSGAPVLLLNTVLFSISIIHYLHAVASNIEQRDGAERSGGLLVLLGHDTLLQTLSFCFFSPVFANKQTVAFPHVWDKTVSIPLF